MRLHDTKKQNRKPLPHQKPSRAGRPPKAKEFTREAAFAVKARVVPPVGTPSPWRWYGENGFKDHWFQRSLMPRKKADSLKVDLENLGGQEAKIVTVWRRKQ